MLSSVFMKEKGLCRGTAQKKFVITKMIFDYAILMGHIKYNPCSSVQLPNGMKTNGREFPSDEVLSIVDQSDWLLPFFLLYSGLRRGEALTLTYGDIDREERIIRVNKSVYYDLSSHAQIKGTKSKAGNRKVILLDKLEKVLPNGNPEDLVFPGHDGKIMNEYEFYRDWHEWEKRVGVDVSPHQLRHGYATLLLEAGLDVKDAQDQLGHSSETVTRNIYEHIRDRRRKISAEKLNATAEIFAK